MIAKRTFESYEEYVAMQGGKAVRLRDMLMRTLPRHIASFKRTFGWAKESLLPGAILCLGARSGAESEGAKQAGFDGSVGIDLHPVGENVVQADWHALPYPAYSFPNVYCNSMDHCLYLDRFTDEVKRVLVPGGRFYLMATNRGGGKAAIWSARVTNEAMYWDTSDDLVEEVCKYGFEVLKSWRAGKWGHYVLVTTPNLTNEYSKTDWPPT